MIKCKKQDGQSDDRLAKEFSGRVKSRRLMQTAKKNKYFAQKPTKKKVREAAISRAKYRNAAKKKQFVV